jgi:pyroglutamyl-peptidase
MPERLQTLLTGFGPFGSAVSNPTERLVTHLAGDGVPGHDLTTRVLPVSFARVPELLRAEIEIGGRDGRPFDVILMLGLATGSKCWRVEQFGRNGNKAIEDIDGFMPPAGPIALDAPETFSSTLPTEAILTALEQSGLPAVASENAGGYLCNHALFTVLRYLQQQNHSARAGFLHVPADEQTFKPGVTTAPMFPFDQHIAVVRAVLGVLTNPLPGIQP